MDHDRIQVNIIICCKTWPIYTISTQQHNEAPECVPFHGDVAAAGCRALVKRLWQSVMSVLDRRRSLFSTGTDAGIRRIGRRKACVIYRAASRRRLASHLELELGLWCTMVYRTIHTLSSGITLRWQTRDCREQ